MNLKRTRTCNKCRAVSGRGYELKCDLGYTTQLWRGDGDAYTITPMEPCPKPKTVLEHCQAPKKKFKKGTNQVLGADAGIEENQK